MNTATIKRSLLLLASATMLLVGASYAADHASNTGAGHQAGHGEGHAPGMRRGHGKRLEKMLAAVNATPEQRAAIEAIVKQHKPNMQALQQQHRSYKKAFHGLDPMAANYNSEVAVLAEQHAAIAKQKTLHKAEMRRLIAMQLTAEQRATLKARMEKRMAKRMKKRQQRRQARQASESK